MEANIMNYIEFLLKINHDNEKKNDITSIGVIHDHLEKRSATLVWTSKSFG